MHCVKFQFCQRARGHIWAASVHSVCSVLHRHRPDCIQDSHGNCSMSTYNLNMFLLLHYCVSSGTYTYYGSFVLDRITTEYQLAIQYFIGSYELCIPTIKYIGTDCYKSAIACRRSTKSSPEWSSKSPLANIPLCISNFIYYFSRPTSQYSY